MEHMELLLFRRVVLMVTKGRGESRMDLEEI